MKIHQQSFSYFLRGKKCCFQRGKTASGFYLSILSETIDFTGESGVFSNGENDFSQ